MDIREFNTEELAEINSYITMQIPQSILPQLFLLTEEPIKKIKSFIAIYRIIESCKDFVEHSATKDKINKHLEYSRKAYESLYPDFIEYEATEFERGKRLYKDKMFKVLIENNRQINYTVNTFLVFAEKLELVSTDSVSGIKLDIPEGEEIYNKLITKLD